MLVLRLSILLACLDGCIHCTLAASNFFFKKGSQLKYVSARLGADVTINCTTNDDDANVTLESEQGRSDMIAKQQGRLSRKESVFTIHNVIVHDGGKYICQAMAVDGQTITRVVLLIIDTTQPAITIIPFEVKEIVTGSSTNYTCEGTRTKSKFAKLLWYKIEKITPDGHEIRKIPMPDAVDVSIMLSYDRNRIIRSVLTFTNASHFHSGVYRCELSLEDLLLDRSVQLDVLDPEPAQIIDYSSHDITIIKGNRARLVCVARGFPHPTITWKKDGKTIQVCLSHLPCRETDRYILWPNGLVIKDARYPDDDGVFSCQAKNDFGDDRRSIVVVVPTPPVLNKSVDTLYTWSCKHFRPIEIPCTLTQGSPLPTFSWFVSFCWQQGDIKKQRLCSNWESITRKSVFKVNPPMSTPSLGSILTITSPRIPQSLEVNCTVVNKEGSQDSMVFQVHPIYRGGCT